MAGSGPSPIRTGLYDVFPANRENNRESFSSFGRARRESPVLGAISGISIPNVPIRNRELNLPEQGIGEREQGK